MKKKLLYSVLVCMALAFAYSCGGDDEPAPPPANEKPAAAGAIQGASENDCSKGETTVTLTIGTIERATSYQWYKNGSAISGAKALTYVVTASGTYTVAGVNDAGTGDASAAKAVTITECGGGDFVYTDLLGDYSATGTSGFLQNPGPPTWAGAIVQPAATITEYYAITKWGNSNSALFMDIIDNELVILNDNLGSSQDGYDVILSAFILDDAQGKITYIDKFPLKWNAGTKKLDMSGKYQGFDVRIGLLAVNPTTGAVVGAFTECYADVILTITPASGVSAFSGTKLASKQSPKNPELRIIEGMENVKSVKTVKFDPSKFTRN